MEAQKRQEFPPCFTPMSGFRLRTERRVWKFPSPGSMVLCCSSHGSLVAVQRETLAAGLCGRGKEGALGHPPGFSPLWSTGGGGWSGPVEGPLLPDAHRPGGSGGPGEARLGVLCMEFRSEASAPRGASGGERGSGLSPGRMNPTWRGPTEECSLRVCSVISKTFRGRRCCSGHPFPSRCLSP